MQNKNGEELTVGATARKTPIPSHMPERNNKML
jgi:hypothetical protein